MSFQQPLYIRISPHPHSYHIIYSPRSLTREFFKSFPVTKVRKMKSLLSQHFTAGESALSKQPAVELYLIFSGINQTNFLITDLEPFTVYGVTVTAVSEDGLSSQPSAGVKVVTHVEGERQKTFSTGPALPDIGQCCLQRNVSSVSCIEQYCDPLQLAETSLKDMVMCAPWAGDMFSCLTDQKDHRPCCATRGVSEACLDLCGPEPPSEFQFSHFSCLRHVTDMSACMLEGYGVLPSSPTNLNK